MTSVIGLLATTVKTETEYKKNITFCSDLRGKIPGDLTSIL